MVDNKNTMQYSVLILEDELILGKVCRRILESRGYKAKLAINGVTAKEELEKEKYDFCLSDIRLPVMNGMDFFYMLKEKFPELAKNTFFMTGDVMNKDIGKFLEENKAEYILKPFTDTQLIEFVDAYVQKSKAGAASTNQPAL